jgi:alkylhydroperoxidase family enzyme
MTTGPRTHENLQAQPPAVVYALLALGKAVDDTGLDKGLTELMKLRVSQINGCACGSSR